MVGADIAASLAAVAASLPSVSAGPVGLAGDGVSDTEAATVAVPLRYGPLFADLSAVAGSDSYPLAIELIYEGYLLHYRSSRVMPAEVSPETRLLAGDHYYARGLRLVAAAGDVASVDLLTRLMATCSYLRVERLPFVYDDDLWALTVAAMAALRQGRPAGAGAAAYELIERSLRDGEVTTLRAQVRSRAAALGLRNVAALEAHLGPLNGHR